MDNVYLLVAFIVVLVTAAVAGLLWLDHHFEMKLVKKTGKIVCNDVIPATEEMLNDYTKELMDNAKGMMGDWMKEMTKLI